MQHVHYTYTERKQNKTNKKTPKKEGKKENESWKKELRTSDSLTVDSKWPMGQINTWSGTSPPLAKAT